MDWDTKIITVDQSDLTLVTGTLYELDTDWLRLQLKALEDDEEGIVFPDTHRHNTEVTVAGVTYARVFEIINGYTVLFTPPSHYTVRLAGSNNNIFAEDVFVPTMVSVIGQNAAGLIVSVQGSGVTAQDKLDIAAEVWDSALDGAFTAEELVRLMSAVLAGKLSGAAGPTVTIRDLNDTKDRVVATVDSDGNRTDVTLDGS